jgi:hypothetical protein
MNIRQVSYLYMSMASSNAGSIDSIVMRPAVELLLLLVPWDRLRVNPSTLLPVPHPPSHIPVAADKDRAVDGGSGISSHRAMGVGEGLLCPSMGVPSRCGAAALDGKP